MSKTPNLDFLKDKVSELNNLLQKPEPGILEWKLRCGELLTEITEFWRFGTTKHEKN